MKWSLFELNKHRGETLHFSEVLDLKESLLARDSTILDVGEIKVEADLTVSTDEYVLFMQIIAPLVLPSSRSLTPVPLTLSIAVDETYMSAVQFENCSEAVDKNNIIVLDQDLIDGVAAVEDNILLAIPLQILSEEELENEELPSGNDWEVISEADYYLRQAEQKDEKGDPRLAKLADLLDQEIDD